MLGTAATAAVVDAGIVTPIGGLYEAGIGGDVSWVDFAPVPWLGTFDDILDWGICLAGGS